MSSDNDDPRLDEVTISVAKKDFRGWDDLELHLGIDSHPSVGFKAPFEPTNLDFRRDFKPYGFQRVEVAIGGARAFTGTMMPPRPSASAERRDMQIEAYSLAAEMEKTDVPPELLPMEANKMSLSDIARRLCGHFGIGVVMDGPEGSVFKRVKTRQKKVDGKVEANQKVQDFLAELARQRNLVITSTVEGKMRFWQSAAPGRPVVHLVEGDQPYVNAEVSFNPDDYFSDVTGFTTTKHGQVGTKYTERNRRIAGGFLRYHSFKMDDIEKGDVTSAVQAKLGRMFANAVAYAVSVATWRDPSGKLWEPNTTVTLLSPSAMVYRETELLIRDVYFKRGRDEGRHATLGLVLPGAFSGKAPDRMPWDE